MQKRENQVTVPLTPTLHDYVARVAEREDRTKAGAPASSNASSRNRTAFALR